MFVSYHSDLSKNINSNCIFKIKDTEFEEDIVCENEWINFVNSFIELYKNHNKTDKEIAKNIFLILKPREKSAYRQIISNIQDYHQPINEELQKLLLLK